MINKLIILLFVFTCIFQGTTYAQEENETKKNIFTVVEKMPEFNGGLPMMFLFLAENIKSLNNKEQKMVIPQLDGFEVVKINSIIRAEASDNYTILYLEENKKYVLSKTLKYYEELLTEYGFLRTHKSHLLNLAQIVKYKKGKVGQAIMSDGSSVLVSSGAKKELMNFFS